MKKYECIKMRGLTLNKIESYKYEVDYKTELYIHIILGQFPYLPVWFLFGEI
jgi:hypothetical protein